MFANIEYFPILNVKPAEMSALQHLPGPDKDRFLPIIGLKKWSTCKSLDNSVSKIIGCFGERPAGLDLGSLGNGTGADKELKTLKDPKNGFQNFNSFLLEHRNFIPTIQTHAGDAKNLTKQIDRLLRLERGIVLRIRRTNNWDSKLLSVTAQINFNKSPILMIFDVGQIQTSADVTVLAGTVSSIASSFWAAATSAQKTAAVAGSSFPSSFVEISRTDAKIDIQERRLHSVLNQQVTTKSDSLSYKYADYGSVFAGDRGFAQTGNAIRVDYPIAARWIYRRSEEINPAITAARAIINEPEWNKDLKIWGTEQIQRASKGSVEGLKYQRDWTAVRINIHLHRQANFGGGLVPTDEPWTD